MAKEKSCKLPDDEIFYEIESELPEDLSGLMCDGRHISPHNREWLNDDGR